MRAGYERVTAFGSPTEVPWGGLPVQSRSVVPCARRCRPLLMCGCGAPSPTPWTPGPHRGGLEPGRPDSSSLPRPGRMVAAHRQLGAGAKYYEYNPRGRRLLAEAGFPKGFKTLYTVTSGLGRDRVDEHSWCRLPSKDVGIKPLKIQEYGAYGGYDCAGQVRGHGGWSHCVVWDRWPLVSRLCRDPPATSATSMTHAHGHAQGTTAHQGPGRPPSSSSSTFSAMSRNSSTMCT